MRRSSSVDELVLRRRRELQRRLALADAFGRQDLFDRGEVLRRRRLVATEGGELDRRLGEKGVALRALGAVEAFWRKEEEVSD